MDISCLTEFTQYEFLKRAVIEREMTCVYGQIAFSRIFSEWGRGRDTAFLNGFWRYLGEDA